MCHVLRHFMILTAPHMLSIFYCSAVILDFFSYPLKSVSLSKCNSFLRKGQVIVHVSDPRMTENPTRWWKSSALDTKIKCIPARRPEFPKHSSLVSYVSLFLARMRELFTSTALSTYLSMWLISFVQLINVWKDTPQRSYRKGKVPYRKVGSGND